MRPGAKPVYCDTGMSFDAAPAASSSALTWFVTGRLTAPFEEVAVVGVVAVVTVVAVVAGVLDDDEQPARIIDPSATRTQRAQRADGRTLAVLPVAGRTAVGLGLSGTFRCRTAVTASTG